MVTRTCCVKTRFFLKYSSVFVCDCLLGSVVNGSKNPSSFGLMTSSLMGSNGRQQPVASRHNSSATPPDLKVVGRGATARFSSGTKINATSAANPHQRSRCSLVRDVLVVQLPIEVGIGKLAQGRVAGGIGLPVVVTGRPDRESDDKNSGTCQFQRQHGLVPPGVMDGFDFVG